MDLITFEKGQRKDDVAQNGIRSTEAPARVQRIADTLDAAKIDAVFGKWLRRIPHPFAPAHRAAGYRYQLSILQAEFALTPSARAS